MWLFFLSAGLVFYILIGYPTLLHLLARIRPRPYVSRPSDYRVSIIIPVHNGARFLRNKLESVLNLDYPRHLMEVIVVSDGSTDETVETALSFAGSGVKVLPIPRSGKAAALNAAAARAFGEILVLTDVRQELHPEAMHRLLAPFADPEIGVVSGELVIRDSRGHEQTGFAVFRQYESWIRKNLSCLGSMIGATGALYALRRELFSPVPDDILLDDVYVPMTAVFRKYRVVFEAQAVAYDYPTTRGLEFERKVRTLGGNYQLLARMPQLAAPSNPLLWHFLSYKLGRLLLPWLFLILAVSTFTIPGRWGETALAGEILFCALAILDPIVPERNSLKRFSSGAKTFFVLMAATVHALKVLFVPARTLWKISDPASES